MSTELSKVVSVQRFYRPGFYKQNDIVFIDGVPHYATRAFTSVDVDSDIALGKFEVMGGGGPADVDWNTQQGDGTENAVLDFASVAFQGFSTFRAESDVLADAAPGTISGFVARTGELSASENQHTVNLGVSDGTLDDPTTGDLYAFSEAKTRGQGIDDEFGSYTIAAAAGVGFGAALKLQSSITAGESSFEFEFRATGTPKPLQMRWNGSDMLVGFFAKQPVARPNLDPARANIAAEVATLNGVATGLGDALLALFDALGNGTTGLGLIFTE